MLSQFFVDTFKTFYIAYYEDVGCSNAPGWDYFLSQSSSYITPTNNTAVGNMTALFKYVCVCADGQSGHGIELFQIGNVANQFIAGNLSAIANNMNTLCQQANQPAEVRNIALLAGAAAGGLIALCCLGALIAGCVYHCKKQNAAASQNPERYALLPGGPTPVTGTAPKLTGSQAGSAASYATIPVR
jgi:hypothetical protein